MEFVVFSLHIALPSILIDVRGHINEDGLAILGEEFNPAVRLRRIGRLLCICLISEWELRWRSHEMARAVSSA